MGLAWDVIGNVADVLEAGFTKSKGKQVDSQRDREKSPLPPFAKGGLRELPMFMQRGYRVG